MTRGYFGVALCGAKNEINIGGVLRSAQCFGAAFVGVVGQRYKRQSSDTMNATQHIPLLHWRDSAAMYDALPHGCVLVAVERIEGAQELPLFDHPQRALYVLGPEDGSLPCAVMDMAHRIVTIPAGCLNLASAATVVMYDRVAQQSRKEAT